jgi:hypothetical protein
MGCGDTLEPELAVEDPCCCGKNSRKRKKQDHRSQHTHEYGPVLDYADDPEKTDCSHTGRERIRQMDRDRMYVQIQHLSPLLRNRRFIFLENLSFDTARRTDTGRFRSFQDIAANLASIKLLHVILLDGFNSFYHAGRINAIRFPAHPLTNNQTVYPRKADGRFQPMQSCPIAFCLRP